MRSKHCFLVTRLTNLPTGLIDVIGFQQCSIETGLSNFMGSQHHHPLVTGLSHFIVSQHCPLVFELNDLVESQLCLLISGLNDLIISHFIYLTISFPAVERIWHFWQIRLKWRKPPLCCINDTTLEDVWN